MFIKWFGIICFLALFSLSNVNSRSVSKVEDGYPVSVLGRSLESVFKAIEKILVFYKRQYKNLIIDGVYGLRVLEGTIYTVLKENKNGDLNIPLKTQKRILKMAVTASKIAVKSYPYLKRFDPTYFEVMGFTVLEPWHNIKPLKMLHYPEHNHYSPSNQKQLKMDEETQDKCFNALTGDSKKSIPPCTVSDECWKINTSPGQKKYYLTHQLLYFLLGQVKGCSNVFESRFKAEAFDGGMERFLSISCHAMYPEMKKQEKIAIEKKHLGEIDLYMEQAVVCGMFGYIDFFSIDRLNLILNWRHKDGCFGFTDEIGGREDEENGETDQRSNPEGKQTMRKLKVTRDLEGGCEVHATGVGTGLLALYLRWMLHMSYPKSTSDQDKLPARIYTHRNRNSYNLMTMFMLFSVLMTALVIFSKRLGLRNQRNRLMRKVCPCL